MATLIDFFACLADLNFSAGENIKLHVAKMEAHFARLIGQDVDLPEAYKVAIFLASVRHIPQFQHFISAATLMPTKDVHLAQIKERLSSTYALSETDRRHEQLAHSSTYNRKNFPNKQNNNNQKPRKRPHTLAECKDPARHDQHVQQQERMKQRQSKTFKSSNFSNAVAGDEINASYLTPTIIK
jgi:hypothetical protein